MEINVTIVEELTKQDLMTQAFNTQCSFETDFPPNLLSGSVYVRVSEAENPGVPAQIIDSNEGWLIDVYWNLYGQAAQLICGTWRLKVFMESLGRDDLDIALSARISSLKTPTIIKCSLIKCFLLVRKLPGFLVEGLR